MTSGYDSYVAELKGYINTAARLSGYLGAIINSNFPAECTSDVRRVLREAHKIPEALRTQRISRNIKLAQRIVDSDFMIGEDLEDQIIDNLC